MSNNGEGEENIKRIVILCVAEEVDIEDQEEAIQEVADKHNLDLEEDVGRRYALKKVEGEK